VLAGHTKGLNAVAFSPDRLAFSPDGSILAACSHDGAVKLWRAEPIDPYLGLAESMIRR
jgi:WD40 repeat protein